MVIEERLAVGHIQLQIVSRGRGAALAKALRDAGFGVTEMSARGKDGTVRLLNASVLRRDVGACQAHCARDGRRRLHDVRGCPACATRLLEGVTWRAWIADGPFRNG